MSFAPTPGRTVFTPTPSKTTDKPSPDHLLASKLEFVAALQNHQSDASTDFTIVSGWVEFKVHRIIVSMHSGYFKRLCAPDSKFKEAEERKATLKDDPTLAIRLMITYFYTFDYADPMSALFRSDAGNPRNSLEGHSQVFALADKYDIGGLRELALLKFTAATNPIFTGSFFVQASFQEKLAADLIIAIPHVFHNAPPKDDRLRKAALAPWGKKGGDMLRYADKEDLKDVFDDVPEFAVELLAGTAGLEIGSAIQTGKGAEEKQKQKEGMNGKTIDFGGSKSAGVLFGGTAPSST